MLPTPMRGFYHWVLLPAALAGAALLALGSRKLRANLLARRGVWYRFAQALPRRDPARPLVWFHVASAGELLQAEPLLRRLRAEGAQLVLTLSSVSGLGWVQRRMAWPELIWADLLPFDLPGAARRLLAALRPDALVYVQADLWPGLVWEARRRGIPQVLLAARLGAEPAAPLRPHYRELYRSLTRILALSEADRERLARLVPGHPHLTVGGDPGIETVFARLAEAAAPPLPAGFIPAGATVLIVGSSWPADEARWLPAARDALAADRNLRLIVAPHEPAEPGLRALETALAAHGTVRLSRLAAHAGSGGAAPEDAPTARALLVDSVGKLAGLYRAGTVAYVGGGFTTGVHNVAEPAAAGVPVVFGPRHRKSAAAQVLLEAGAAFAVADAAAARRALSALLAEPERARALGERARAAMVALAGAAERCHEALRATVPALGGTPGR
ncbi:MAG: 3-deoxy-D-manno-octulosonic acid transferase [Candidatus Lambdaproteobacteria bacterium]|nr:3-deoxy-D-manno-octulosonic acid transferase [Candidatus Lambdaproteobacteria bacterium]